MDQPLIEPSHMCQLHQRLLVQQAGYSEQDTWRALIIVSQIVLFQGATCDPATHEKLGGDITRIRELGCLACYKPDRFGEIVEAAKTHDLGVIKALGLRWIAEAEK